MFFVSCICFDWVMIFFVSSLINVDLFVLFCFKSLMWEFGIRLSLIDFSIVLLL